MSFFAPFGIHDVGGREERWEWDAVDCMLYVRQLRANHRNGGGRFEGGGRMLSISSFNV